MNRRRRGDALAAVSLAAATLTLVSACTPSGKPQAIARFFFAQKAFVQGVTLTGVKG